VHRKLYRVFVEREPARFALHLVALSSDSTPKGQAVPRQPIQVRQVFTGDESRRWKTNIPQRRSLPGRN
jgi:hypothetical protein